MVRSSTAVAKIEMLFVHGKTVLVCCGFLSYNDNADLVFAEIFFSVNMYQF